MGLECAMWMVTPKQLEELRASDEAVEQLVCGEHPTLRPRCLDIGKAWHALHFLLTGNAEGGDSPLDLAIMCGYPLAEPSLEGTQYLPPEEVKDVDQALAGITVRNLRKRFCPERMREVEVYCEAAVDDGDLEECFIPDFRRLKRFYHEAARRRMAVVRSIC